MVETADIARACVDCAQTFVIPHDEQQWIEEQRSANPAEVWALPKRCATCRHWRRAQRQRVPGE